MAYLSSMSDDSSQRLNDILGAPCCICVYAPKLEIGEYS
jgi:hypothetical protein